MFGHSFNLKLSIVWKMEHTPSHSVAGVDQCTLVQLCHYYSENCKHSITRSKLDCVNTLCALIIAFGNSASWFATLLINLLECVILMLGMISTTKYHCLICSLLCSVITRCPKLDRLKNVPYPTYHISSYHRVAQMLCVFYNNDQSDITL